MSFITPPVTNDGTFATPALQSDGNTSLDSIDTKLDGPIPVTGTVTVDTSLLSTAALQTTEIARLTSILAQLDVALSTRALESGGNLASILAALSGSLTVIATNLDIRDLVFSSDKIDVSGSSSVGITNANLDSSLSGILTELQQKTEPANQQHTIIDSGTTIVTATDLDIRDLTFASDKVDVSGSSSVGVTGPLTDTQLRLTPVQVGTDGVVDSANSTTTPLGANATFTGTSTDMLSYMSVRISIFSDQDSASSGSFVQFSSDGTNWDTSFAFIALASVGITLPFSREARFFRLIYKNGAIAQSILRIQTIQQRATDQLSRSQLGNSVLQDSDVGLLTRSAIVGHTTAGGGAYINVKVNPSGAISVDATATDLDIRDLTFATDSVDVSGSTVTVDGLLIDQGTDGDDQVGVLSQGLVTDLPQSYLPNSIYPISLTAEGRLRVSSVEADINKIWQGTFNDPWNFDFTPGSYQSDYPNAGEVK
jgi:hypothetical protein